MRFDPIGTDRLLCRVSNKEYFFGWRCRAPAAGNWSGFSFPNPLVGVPFVTTRLPRPVYAAAIGEGSEVRSVLVNGTRVTEGSPVWLKAATGDCLVLDRDDYTDGHLELVLLTRECGTAFLSLPTLIHDFARVSFDGTLPANPSYATFQVHAPRIRGVRHVAAVFGAQHTLGGGATLAAVVEPSWPRPGDDTLVSTYGTGPAIGDSLNAERVTAGAAAMLGASVSLIAAGASGSLLSLATAACPARVAKFTFTSSGAAGVAFADFGWCAP